MKKTSMYVSALGVTLLVAGSALATNYPAGSQNLNDLQLVDPRGAEKTGASGYERLAPAMNVSRAIGNNTVERAPQQTIQLAQSSDAAFRVSQLEEQVRQLNGRVEELTFQLLQMQEQIRRMQEDNEFRFQELEEKRGSLSTGNDESDLASNQQENGLGKAEPSVDDTTSASAGGEASNSGNDEIAGLSPDNETNDQAAGNGNGNSRQTIDGVEIFDPDNPGDTDSSDAARLGRLEQSLGTIIFDEDGNVVDTAIGKPLDLTERAGQGAGDVTLPDNPDELYKTGYGYIQSGDYDKAELAFTQFGEQYSDDERVSEAMFWKGESLFARNEFKEAAQVFLETHKQWPDSRLGAQNLLKLGLSLAGLNQRELACATYAEIPNKYPGMSAVLERKVVAEQTAAKCLTN